MRSVLWNRKGLACETTPLPPYCVWMAPRHAQNTCRQFIQFLDSTPDISTKLLVENRKLLSAVVIFLQVYLLTLRNSLRVLAVQRIALNIHKMAHIIQFLTSLGSHIYTYLFHMHAALLFTKGCIL